MKSQLPDPVELTRKLIAFDTRNPPGDEEALAEYISSLLSPYGFEIDLAPLSDKRAGLIAKIGNSDSPLCFTGHLDTVPFGNEPWDKDPLRSEIVDGKLYGRGASDMKSGVAAMVCSAAALSQLFEKAEDNKSLFLILTAGEETGCSGASEMAKNGTISMKAGALVVGEPTDNYPVIGHKGALWLKAEAKGVSAHGSMPEMGDNAIYKIAKAALTLSAFDFNAPSHPVLGGPTLNVGIVMGGVNYNLVPDHAELGIDIRTIPTMSHDDIFNKIKTALGEDISLSTVISAEGVYTDYKNDWIQNVYRISESVSGAHCTPRSVAYFTDASELNHALDAPPIVILGPGEPSTAHKVNEYVKVKNIITATDIYTRIGKEWLIS